MTESMTPESPLYLYAALSFLVALVAGFLLTLIMDAIDSIRAYFNRGHVTDARGRRLPHYKEMR